VLGVLFGPIALALGDRDADHVAAVTFGSKSRHRTPTASDIEHAISRPQPQLPGDEIHLRSLRLVQALRGRPICTRVRHSGPEHSRKEIVAEIVVLFGNLAGAPDRLQVPKSCPGDEQPVAPLDELVIDVVAQRTMGHLVQARTVPPSVHVALAKPKCSERQHARKEAVIVDADVPGSRAIDRDASGAKDPLERVPRAGLTMDRTCDSRDNRVAHNLDLSFKRASAAA
jgi:hypothetical protein